MQTDWIQRGLLFSQNPIFKKFLGKAGTLIAKPAKLGIFLTTAYSKLVDTKSGKGGIEQLKEVMQTFIRLVKAYSNGSYKGVATKSIVVGVGVLLYFVSPIDIIPDFLPAIGLLDDLSLIAWFVNAFQTEIEKFRNWEAGQRFDSGGFEPTVGTL